MTVRRFTKFLVTFSAVLALGSAAFAQSKKVDVIFMHDTHSFLDATPKIKTLIDAQKKINPDTLVLDAGDFAMGTLYQTVFSTQAAELRVLGKLGVEATTIGNHEFDFGAEGLANMFLAAKNSGDTVPEFVLCNADWNKENAYTKTVKDALDVYGTQDYIMLEKNGVQIAVVGVFGKDALRCAPTCELSFEEITTAVKRTVDYIKANEKADLIVCISHSGTNKNPAKSEDELLAKAVPELDLIISGHTHTVLGEPIISDKTVIASCGAYNKHLGNLSLEQEADGRWKLTSYRLDDLSADIAEDKNIKNFLNSIGPVIDSEYLAQFGLTSRQILAENTKDQDIDHETGYLMAEAMYNTVKKMGIPVDFATVPSGVLRSTYKKGNVTVSDVFESYSLGIGPDGISGYPLIAVWLSGKAIKNVCEIDNSLSPVEDTVRLFMHGVTYDYNPKRMIFDRVTDVYRIKEDGTKEKLKNNQLYCAVVDIYTGMMLGSVLDMTKGLVVIQARNEDGSLVTEWNDKIIYRPNGTELKGWISIAEGLAEMKQIGDFSAYEDYYRTAKPSSNPFKLLKNPSKIARLVRSILIMSVLIIVLIVVLCVKLNKKKKAKKLAAESSN